jgi:hypothetical protein
MSQKSLRNRIIELGEEDEEELFGPYGQGSAEDMENSDSQEAVAQRTEPPVEVSPKNPPTPEPVPSTSVESTTRASRGFNFDLQQLFQMLEENRQRDKKEQEERDKKNQQILEENRQKDKKEQEENRQKDKKEQEEKERLNQQKQERDKVEVVEILKKSQQEQSQEMVKILEEKQKNCLRK